MPAAGACTAPPPPAGRRCTARGCSPLSARRRRRPNETRTSRVDRRTAIEMGTSHVERRRRHGQVSWFLAAQRSVLARRPRAPSIAHQRSSAPRMPRRDLGREFHRRHTRRASTPTDRRRCVDARRACRSRSRAHPGRWRLRIVAAAEPIGLDHLENGGGSGRDGRSADGRRGGSAAAARAVRRRLCAWARSIRRVAGAPLLDVGRTCFSCSRIHPGDQAARTRGSARSWRSVAAWSPGRSRAAGSGCGRACRAAARRRRGGRPRGRRRSPRARRRRRSAARGRGRCGGRGRRLGGARDAGVNASAHDAASAAAFLPDERPSARDDRPSRVVPYR